MLYMLVNSALQRRMGEMVRKGAQNPTISPNDGDLRRRLSQILAEDFTKMAARNCPQTSSGDRQVTHQEQYYQ